MKLIPDFDGIPGLVPRGYGLPALIDSRGYLIVSVFLYMVFKVSTNAWRSFATARTIGQRLLDIFAFFEDQNIPFGKVAVNNLTEYRDFKLKEGVDGKPCCESSVNLALNAFQDYWRWALKEQLIIESAAVSIVDYYVRTTGLPAFADMRLPTGEEIVKFSHYLRGPEQHLANGLSFATGLRRAEITSLPADILLPIERMEQRRGAILLRLDGHHAPTKGNKPRTIEVPRRLYGAMINYKISDRRARRIERSRQESTLLVTKYGLPCQPDWLNDVFSLASKFSGIQIHPHLNRHYYATRFLEYETPTRFKGNEYMALKELQRLLGHSHIRTTMGYTHVAIEEGGKKNQALTGYQQVIDEIIRDSIYA